MLLDRFGSLPALLRSGRAALATHLPHEPQLVELLVAVHPLIRQMLLREMFDAPALPDSRAALDYLTASMAHETSEQVRVLFLNARNRVIAQEIVARGSSSRADISPREIMRRALELGATGMIMAHNHPSGDPQPSRADIHATRAVSDAAQLFDIELRDHIIIGRQGWISLRDEGHL